MNFREKRQWFWLFLFGLAMGLLEAAVVVYLRALYYPQGFDFPMAVIPLYILGIEICREIATIVMLFSLSWLIGRNTPEKLAWFLYSFAIWDLSYYLFLYVFLGWPPSLLTWDLLFLIPVVWTAPVLAPVLVSFTFIILAWGIIEKNMRSATSFSWLTWLFLAGGSFILIISFLNDYVSYMLHYISWYDFWNSEKANTILHYSTQYVPHSYSWFMFFVGELMLLGAVWLYRTRR